MKLRLVLKTEMDSNKEISIKFNVAPSKQQGILNLIQLASSKDQQVSMTFEKISKSGEREESKLEGLFKFTIDTVQLTQLMEEVDTREKRRKKQHQKRVSK